VGSASCLIHNCFVSFALKDAFFTSLVTRGASIMAIRTASYEKEEEKDELDHATTQ
jgi:hypothetical protein